MALGGEMTSSLFFPGFCSKDFDNIQAGKFYVSPQWSKFHRVHIDFARENAVAKYVPARSSWIYLTALF